MVAVLVLVSHHVQSDGQRVDVGVVVVVDDGSIVDARFDFKTHSNGNQRFKSLLDNLRLHL